MKIIKYLLVIFISSIFIIKAENNNLEDLVRQTSKFCKNKIAEKDLKDLINELNQEQKDLLKEICIAIIDKKELKIETQNNNQLFKELCNTKIGKCLDLFFTEEIETEYDNRPAYLVILCSILLYAIFETYYGQPQAI